MELVKATIEQIIPKSGKKIKVQFNPNQYSVSSSNQFGEVSIPGLQSPLIQFVRGQIRNLKMELFFDSYEAQRDVRELTKEVTDLLKINPETHAPPVLMFQWGSLCFACVLEQAEQSFILFFPDGKPARAKLQVSFKEFTNNQNPESPNRSATYDKIYIVQTGDSLAGISAMAYEDPRLWRHIADHNKIDSPRMLMPGQILAIPPLD